MTHGQLAADFLSSCTLAGLAGATIRSYTSKLRPWLAHAGVRRRLKTRGLDELVRSHLEIRARTLASPNHDRRVLHSLFSFARARRYLSCPNPAAAELHRLRRPRAGFRRQARCLSRTEDLDLRREAIHHDLWPVVLLCRWAGLRRGEACFALWTDVDPEGAFIDLPGHEGGRKHPRRVWLAPWVGLQLRGIFGDPDWPCVPGERLWRKTTMTADRHLHTICEQAELRRFGWNTLRATFVTECFASGMTAKEESLIVGHSPAVAERHYSEWCARKARMKLPNDPLLQGTIRARTKGGHT